MSSVSPSNRKVEMVIIFVFVVCLPNQTTKCKLLWKCFERFYLKYLNSLFWRYTNTHTWQSDRARAMSWVKNISACGSWDWYPVNECHFFGLCSGAWFCATFITRGLNNANEIDTALWALLSAWGAFYAWERNEGFSEVQGRSSHNYIVTGNMSWSLGCHVFLKRAANWITLRWFERTAQAKRIFSISLHTTFAR